MVAVPDYCVQYSVKQEALRVLICLEHFSLVFHRHNPEGQSGPSQRLQNKEIKKQ